jgi:SOS-response transcriptional repressor LexA
MDSALRPRQQQIAARRHAILLCFAETERPFGTGAKGPSIREVMHRLIDDGYENVSLGNVYADLQKLRECGDLQHLGGDLAKGETREPRPYRLTDQGRSKVANTANLTLNRTEPPVKTDNDRSGADEENGYVVPLSWRPYDPPVLGHIAAGSPISPIPSHIDDTTLLGLLDCHPEDAVFRVRGSSMEDAGIHDEDYIIVRAQPVERLSKNDIFVVMVTESGEPELTLKRLERRDGGLVLHPVNATGLDWRSEKHQHKVYGASEVSVQGRLLWTVCPHHGSR